MERKTTGQQGKQKNKNRMPMNAKLKKNEYPFSFYADDQVEQMRGLLANYWSERLDGETMAEVLLVGNEGYDKLDRETLIVEFESIYGENFFGQD